jgi:hypothetical protein
LSGRNRATTGLATAVGIGVLGMVTTAAVITWTGAEHSQNGRTQALHVDQHPSFLPSPVPMPGSTDTVIQPRNDVLTYTALSTAWASRNERQQMKFCQPWAGSDAGSKYRADAVAGVVANAAALGMSNPDQPTIVAFFDNACADLMIGTAVSLDRSAPAHNHKR